MEAILCLLKNENTSLCNGIVTKILRTNVSLNDFHYIRPETMRS